MLAHKSRRLSHYSKVHRIVKYKHQSHCAINRRWWRRRGRYNDDSDESVSQAKYTTFNSIWYNFSLIFFFEPFCLINCVLFFLPLCHPKIVQQLNIYWHNTHLKFVRYYLFCVYVQSVNNKILNILWWFLFCFWSETRSNGCEN